YPLRTRVTPSPRAGGVNHPDRAIQSIPRKSSPGTGDTIVTLTEKQRFGDLLKHSVGGASPAKATTSDASLKCSEPKG
ncbi:hypothetical protein, partial [Bradyrhizobium vignae]|uniref:hypothetical protein n=1 Tax=Bradyrhizobium vignae TaxID=1549949 RepID=UPI001ABFBD2E